VNEDECLQRFGLYPAGGDLGQVREILADQAARERESQGDGDTLLMKLCCVQLFNAGSPADVLLIWHAKESSTGTRIARSMSSCCAAADWRRPWRT